MRRSLIAMSRAGRSRALLAAAVAASLTLPFSGGPMPAAAAPAAQSPDGLIRMALVPGENEARYVMTVRTLGQPPKQAACVTRAVSGEIVMNPDGSVVQELSKIVVDQRTLKCQAPLRDSMAQQLLQTAQHPMAEFAVKSTPGLAAPLPTGDTVFQFAGDQTVRGVSQPTVYDTNANLTPDTLVGQARATLKMTSFGITPPSIGPLIQVADEMMAEVDLKAAIGGPAAAAAPMTAPASEPASGEEPAGEDPASEAAP